MQLGREGGRGAEWKRGREKREEGKCARGAKWVLGGVLDYWAHDFADDSCFFQIGAVSWYRNENKFTIRRQHELSRDWTISRNLAVSLISIVVYGESGS